MILVNLYDYFGVKYDPTRSFSISFIDDFLACSHRTFLSRMLRLGTNTVNLPTFFGKVCHGAIYTVVNQIKEGKLPCNDCPHQCKLNTPARSDLVSLDPKMCPVFSGIRKEFMLAFTPSIKDQILQQADAEGKLEKKSKELTKLQEIGPTLVRDALLNIPIGKVILAEISLKGQIGGYPIKGNPDLLMETSSGLELLDYKTRGTRADRKDFPIRQTLLYRYLFEEEFHQTIQKLGVVYLIKNGSVLIDSLDKSELAELYSHTIKMLKSDIESVSACMKAGLFTRNRRDMFCPCEHAAICENLEATRKAYEKQKEQEATNVQETSKS